MGMKDKPSINKGRRIVGCILLALCAVGLVYCTAVLVWRLVTVAPAARMSAIVRFLAELGIACLGTVPALDLGFGLLSWRHSRATRALGMVVRVAAWALCAVLVVLGVAIAATGASPSREPAAQVCVLGLAIQGDDLPQDLVCRLQRAIDYQTEHPDALFVATGGNSEDPDQSEAAQMVRYLAQHGFDTAPQHLVAETNARTTVENFVFSATYVDKTQPVGIITNNYHIFRAAALAKKQGYTTIVRIPAPSVGWLYGENVLWEAICSFAETLQGDMAY